MYYEYLIFSEIMPTRLTLHSVVSHFFGTKDLSKIKYRVEMEANIIRIKTDKFLEGDFEIELVNLKNKKFKCKLFKVNECKNIDFKEDSYTVCGIIEYGVNSLAPIKESVKRVRCKRCPIHLGKFQGGLEKIFKENIEKKMGVKVIEMTNTSFNRMPSEELLKDKVQLNNLIYMNLKVKVVNKDLFNELQYKSIFQKKSYGLGNINII